MHIILHDNPFWLSYFKFFKSDEDIRPLEGGECSPVTLFILKV